MTPRQQHERFAKHNSNHKIVSGRWCECLAYCGRRWENKFRYTFEDGADLYLTKSAVNYGDSINYEPRWT